MKRTYSRIIVILAIASGLAACTSYSGNIRATNQDTIEKIKIGKTTKNEVLALLGDTQNIMRDGGKDTWIYQYSQTDVGARAFIPFANMVGESPVNVKLSTLTIVYNQDGIVENIISRNNAQ